MQEELFLVITNFKNCWAFWSGRKFHNFEIFQALSRSLSRCKFEMGGASTANESTIFNFIESNKILVCENNETLYIRSLTAPETCQHEKYDDEMKLTHFALKNCQSLSSILWVKELFLWIPTQSISDFLCYSFVTPLHEFD